MLIKERIKYLEEGTDVREQLIELKNLLKEDSKSATGDRKALLYCLNGDLSVFEKLLHHEDAKVRKNTAFVLGYIGISDYMAQLYSAYQEETQLFVKSAYLSAIRQMDYQSLLPELKAEWNRLIAYENEPDNKKHILECCKELSEMIIQAEGICSHKFTGYQELSEIIFITNREQKNVIAAQLAGIPKKLVGAGVLVKTDKVVDILELRTYQEALFMLPDLVRITSEPIKAASQIAESKLLEFLEKRHKGAFPFYFRIEVKSKMDLEKRSRLTKRIGSEIEILTKHKLINSPSKYEFELRLIETKEGDFHVLLKLFTIPDQRFSYRKNAIASSMRPVNAALAAELCKEYLIENAQVLDPFCGVGTMLIERNLCVSAKTMYGLDTFGDAIRFARENAEDVMVNENTGHLSTINFINRDFFDFKHDYLFDEIFTDMPWSNTKIETHSIVELYQSFFLKAPKHLKPGAIVVLYTHNRDLVRKFGGKAPFVIKKEFLLSEKKGIYVVVLQYSPLKTE